MKYTLQLNNYIRVFSFRFNLISVELIGYLELQKEKHMKKLIIVILAGMMLAGCSPSTELMVTWKTGEYAPKQYKNIGILAVLKSNEARVDVETSIRDALQARGIKGTDTWTIWQFANNPEIMKKMGMEGEKLKEVIKQKVAEQQMDALLIVSLFDSFKEERYVPGKSTSVGVGFSPGMYPAYGYPYYGYVGYSFNTMSTPGYYTDASTYFVESNLYDIASEKLIWTGQTRTKMESSLEVEAAKLGRVLVNGMIKDKVLAK